MKKHIWKWVLMLVAVVGSTAVKATDVSNNSQLREALSRGDGYIKLTKNIEVGKTDNPFVLSKGNVNLDLNGYTISNGVVPIVNQNYSTVILNITGGHLILTDSKGGGKVYGVDNFWGQKNTIELNGGSLDVHATVVSGKVKAIYVNNSKSKLYIKDGANIYSENGSDPSIYFYKDNGSISFEGGIVDHKGGGKSIQIDGGRLSDITTPDNYKLYQNGKRVDLTQSSISGNVGITRVYNILNDYDSSKGTVSVKVDNVETTWAAPGETVNVEAAPNNGYKVNDYEESFIMPSNDKTLNFEFSPIQYKITYHNVEAATNDNPSTYTIEDNVVLNEAQKNGFKFYGWYKDESLKDKITLIEPGNTGDFNLYADFAEIYTIKYNIDPKVGSIEPSVINYTSREKVTLTEPKLLDSKDYFAGWYDNENLEGTPITEYSVGTTGNKNLYAKVVMRYSISFVTGIDDITYNSIVYSEVSQTIKLPTSHNLKPGYTVEWYDNKECIGNKISEIASGSKGDKILYAKWVPIVYSITYDYLYDGKLPDNVKKTYTIEDKTFTLPAPTRSNFTFVGWHTKESTEWTKEDIVTQVEGGSIGNKTFYAEWRGGRVVEIRQPEGGKITVKKGNEEITSGTVVDPGIKLDISVAATSSAFKFKQLWVNGKSYDKQPITVEMPDSCGITVFALMDDGRPQASAPSMSVSPENVSALPAGGSAEVTLYGGESGGKLYYRIGGIEKEYTGKFLVTSSKEGVVVVEGISRKEGYKDGVTTREITFGTGNISITFDLPEGVTAVNPDGGEVETAVATGGSFKFKLVVDSKIIETPATAIKVYANGRQLSRGTGNTYVLSELKENVTVTVGNVKYKNFAVKLKQTDGGRIAFVGIAGDSCSVVYGDTIQLEAFPNAGYFFTAWNDNSKQNPRELIVKKAQTVSATFSKEKMVYMVTFPQIDGVTVKTLSGYSQQVDKNGTCKFWLDIDAQYKSSEPVVKVNGEVIEPTETGVYSLYYIREHKSVSVEGITRDKITLSQKTNTSITNVETGKDATKEGLYAGDMVTLYAKAPAGKMFSKWNDGVTENPRMMTASDAQGVQPLFVSASGETESLSFTLPAGAGVVSLSGNLNAVEKGGSARFKIVLLPQYAGSKIVVKAAEKVLQQEMELRASTEAETYVYSLNNISENTTVTVEGLTLGSYTLTLEQTENGKVEADKTGEQLYGTVVNLTATPEAEYMFLRWSDGNTLNPYPYTITKNVTLKAEFLEADKMVVDNEEIAAQDARIYTANGSLYVELSQPSDLKVWNFSGVMLINRDIAPGLSSYPLPAGDYLVRVGNNKVVKVMVK